MDVSERERDVPCVEAAEKTRVHMSPGQTRRVAISSRALSRVCHQGATWQWYSARRWSTDAHAGNVYGSVSPKFNAYLISMPTHERWIISPEERAEKRLYKCKFESIDVQY